MSDLPGVTVTARRPSNSGKFNSRDGMFGLGSGPYLGDNPQQLTADEIMPIGVLNQFNSDFYGEEKEYEDIEKEVLDEAESDGSLKGKSPEEAEKYLQSKVDARWRQYQSTRATLNQVEERKMRDADPEYKRQQEAADYEQWRVENPDLAAADDAGGIRPKGSILNKLGNPSLPSLDLGGIGSISIGTDGINIPDNPFPGLDFAKWAKIFEQARKDAAKNGKELTAEEIEELRKKALISEDTAEPPTKLNPPTNLNPPIDPNINPLTGQPYDGGINVGGLTPEQLEEYGLKTPTEKEINTAIDLDTTTTPEEKKLLKKLLDERNKKRLADGKDPQVGGGFWSNVGILTGVAGGVALLGNLFGGGSSSKPTGGVANLPGSTTTPPGSTTTPPGSTTPVPGSVTPGTAKEAYDIALQEGGYDTLSENGKSMAKGHATTLPKGIVPKWLMLLLGLGALLGGNEDSDPTSLQEAAEKRSLEVYGRDDLFDPAGPSPLQQLDPAFKDIKTFMPEGQVPDFNLGYKGVPNQLYANYEGTGPGGVSGPRGVIQEKAYGGLMSLASGGSTSYPRMNGQIAGPGTEKSDDIPAMLSDGEFVVNAAAVRGIGNLMGRKKPKSKVDQRREGARTMYALQKAGEQAARTA